MGRSRPCERNLVWLTALRTGTIRRMDLMPLLRLYSVHRASNQPLDDVPDEPESLSHSVGGLTLEDGLYRIHTAGDAAHWTATVTEAFPEFAGRTIAFACDWLGRQFATDT